jgi:NAD(P)-dependent dehydrogenase (short-subunit alcohol dehydrogenase family)
VTATGRLAGKRCLIVGGTGGIGAATARRFLHEGASVVVTGLTTAEAHEALDALRPHGPVWALPADVTDAEGVERLFHAAQPLLGDRLDVLVHVAGVSGRKAGDGPLHECTTAGWDAVFAVNARGTFLTNQAAVRRMLAQAPDGAGLRGSVVNVGSVLDRAPSPGFFGTVAYAASKGAVRALTRASAARYARDGIRFNLLVPALIDTPMASRAVNDPEIRAFLASKQPLAGGPGTAADCAEAALYLCEPASRFVTGVELLVDGGWCLTNGSVGPTPPGSETASVITTTDGAAPDHETSEAKGAPWPWPEFED